MTVYNIFENIQRNLEIEKPRLKTDKIPTHAPSSSMCYSAIDGEPIGTCIRSAYLRKTGIQPSNPVGMYVRMAQEAGKIWEQWIIDQYKDLGIYVDHSVRVLSLEYRSGGEIDILHTNPNTNELEISEIKQYNGSNFYAASSLKGNSKQAPAPKDQNLLQCFEYLLATKDTIKRINLVYIDRSCGAWFNNVQFVISLVEIKGLYYPEISYYDKNNSIESYTDFRINDKVIMEKRDQLEALLDIEQIPPKDFKVSYTAQEIEVAHARGEISKTKYNKWRESNTPIGDWQCQYCPFGPGEDGFSVCESLD